jgi:hypothetical protein
VASVAERTRRRNPASSYVRWHFPTACGLLLLLSLIAFWDNLVTDVTQPSNSNPAMVIHGLFLLAWVVLLHVQSLLPRIGRIDLHRRVGPYAFLVGVGVVASTIWLFVAVWKGWDAVRPEVLANRILLPSYAFCLVAAWHHRRRPDWHKRLVYCGTLLLLEPVLARTFDPIVGPLLPPMAPGADMPLFFGWLFGTWSAFFAGLAVYDLLSRGRVHPITAGSVVWLCAVVAFAFAAAPAT